MSFRALKLVTACFAAIVVNGTPRASIAEESPSPAASASPTASTSPAASTSPTPSASPAAPGVRPFPQPVDWPRIIGSTVRPETIGPGAVYERVSLVTASGPLELSIATLDLRNPYVKLAVRTQRDKIIGPGERLTSMADRVGAELGINADYFDINETGSPLNVVAADGKLLHQPDASAAFVLDSHNLVQMGPLTWQVRLASGAGAQRDITVVNEWTPATSLALLTPEFGASKADGATEIVLAQTPQPGQYRAGEVDGNLAAFHSLAAGDLAIAARGAEADSLASDFHSGDLVTIVSQTDPAFDGIRLAVGGGPLLMKDGRLFDDPSPPAPEETLVRNPVTGAGISSDGATLWLVVVDGRAPSRSIGLTRPQLASLFGALGAATAMAFDSGGSAEMVVRHLGNRAVDVANTPSDGRERAIADGLFVLNAAPVGAPVSLLLSPPDSTAVLVGSNLPVAVRAIDANDNPLAIPAADIAYRIDRPDLGTIAADGVLTTLGAGVLTLNASASGAQGSVSFRIVPGIDDLQIAGAGVNVPIGGRAKLGIDARTMDGSQIFVDPSKVMWKTTGGGARVLSDGTFIAGSVPARTLVTAQAGGATASATVLTGEHAVIVQAVPQTGRATGQWRYSARPAELTGAVDNLKAPDGSPALRLAYDFSSVESAHAASSTASAAYAQTRLSFGGAPIALSIDVYGDGNGEWLRGGYENADGNRESLTVARHVDWIGWRRIRVGIPPQAAWPIVWTRFYVIERAKETRKKGWLWFRNLSLRFAGPPSGGP